MAFVILGLHLDQAGISRPSTEGLNFRESNYLYAELISGAHRIVMPGGTAVPSTQVTDQDSVEVLADLEHSSTMDPTSLDALLGMLYTASSHSDRSRIAPALDRLLAYVDHWRASSPERVGALFDQLDPSRLVRAVGQTLLAATRLAGDRSVARQEFLSRFFEDLRVRGTAEAIIARLRKGLEE